MGYYDEAVEDGDETIKWQPSWYKVGLCGLGKFIINVFMVFRACLKAILAQRVFWRRCEKVKVVSAVFNSVDPILYTKFYYTGIKTVCQLL